MDTDTATTTNSETISGLAACRAIIIFALSAILVAIEKRLAPAEIC